MRDEFANYQFPSQANTSASTTTQPEWAPKILHDIYVKWCELRLQGLTYNQIRLQSKKWGQHYTTRHISRVLTSPMGRELMSLMSAQRTGGMDGLQAQIQQYVPEAFYRTVDIMRIPVGEVRHRLAAQESIMDRGGLPKISRQENENRLPTTVTINILPQQLQQLLAPPPPITAEVVEIEPARDSTTDE